MSFQASYRELSEAIVEEVKLRTKPVGVKLLREGLGDLGARLIRPMRDLKRRLALCQMIAFSRYYGWALGAELEDISCPGTMLIFGMVRQPDFVKEGALSYGLYAKTKEAAARLDTSMPTLREGVRALATAPLDTTPFDPDVVVIYGTPGQILKLVAAYVYETGEPVRAESYAKAGSDLAILSALLEGKARMFLPGLGDRIVGRVEDSEMGFVVPAKILESLVEGLREQTKTGFVVYPPQPILTYTAHFELIPVVGQYYARILEEASRQAKEGEGVR